MPELQKYYVEFVGSIQVRYGVEVESTSYSEAEEWARRSLPESSLDWSLGDGTNPVIDVELVDCTLLSEKEPHDRDLGRLELEQKYTADGTHWVSHPVYVRDDWVKDVQNGDCEVGYWDWVYDSLHNEDEPDGTETSPAEE